MTLTGCVTDEQYGVTCVSRKWPCQWENVNVCFANVLIHPHLGNLFSDNPAILWPNSQLNTKVVDSRGLTSSQF